MLIARVFSVTLAEHTGARQMPQGITAPLKTGRYE
jgi:hypothetical protein